ncbi:MAG: rhodanese-like domain-containing protein [Gammaproteobacteria bacterium]|jgi:rhodanese-related sulfurtransferase|nr:rhodanese-like domain-containing protein [Gammaproteobacteria bacterium]
MDPYITFLTEHWMLAVAFVAIVLLILLNEWRHRSFGVPGVSPQQLVDILNHQNGVVIDIRTQERFDLGHILGALSVPKESMTNSLQLLNKYKAKPVILVCHLGQDSPKAAQVLKNNGFTQLYFLAGGMEAWRGAGLPVDKK